MAEQDGWKPIHRGEIYCSPRCGMKCTHADYLAALKAADDLCAILGAGWLPRVWENWGYNWSAVKGCCEVFPNRHWQDGHRHTESYTAFFNTASRQFLGKAKDPTDAVGFAVQDANTAILNIRHELQKLLDDATQEQIGHDQ